MEPEQQVTNKENNVTFAWGEPEPISTASMADILGVFFDDHHDYYQPPISPKGLAKLSKENATHRRCINFKVNQMVRGYKQGPVSKRDFKRLALDYQVFSNFYLENITNRAGQILRCQHLPALNMRKGKKDTFKMLRPSNDPIEWQRGEVLHGFEYDTSQSIYGLPAWIGAFHDVMLNSEATLFRRRYYLNGSHLGYILYTNIPDLDKEVEQKIREAVKQGKGVGNFKSMFINSPGGGEKGVQIIPVGDIAQKDEFERIKKISANDIVVAHGIYPQLAAMNPENPGGFGDITKQGEWYIQSELPGLVAPFEELNDFLPSRLHFKFDFKLKP